MPDWSPIRGGRWRDHRRVIDAIAFKYRTGTPQLDLPERFASWNDTHCRLLMSAIDGTWERVFDALLTEADAEEDLDRVVSVDSTIVHTNQHAAGGWPSSSPRPGW
ncbi:transposase [Streptomyces sp. NBC_01214]|uniref:transposase n=1 Tax=Streptomyces sp. NBC_01214 TaxID=2903777 RepID=UPI0022586A1D|nr:transposase [Streptomyces sp. NBC_01214]MCX4804737.1 transposase [Streptomyces sp. NBC_01214]